MVIKFDLFLHHLHFMIKEREKNLLSKTAIRVFDYEKRNFFVPFLKQINTILHLFPMITTIKSVN